jgi:anti-anti-sigma factor
MGAIDLRPVEPIEPVRVESQMLGPSLTLEVTGELDLGTVGGFVDQALTAIGASTWDVRIGLAGVGFLDSSGLKALIQVRDHVTANGGTVSVCNPADRVREVLELSGIVGVIPIE